MVDISRPGGGKHSRTFPAPELHLVTDREPQNVTNQESFLTSLVLGMRQSDGL